MVEYLKYAAQLSLDQIADGLMQAAKAHAGQGLHDDAVIIVIQLDDMSV